ncbi:hypothetical protein QQF64_004195 [Cirrhinus molitorella]|uniref:Uncharacterized protein n=1 Tax=Cirrhinus molitorella TaxID=172907 RepID=A0ABR3MFH8_9TELE
MDNLREFVRQSRLNVSPPQKYFPTLNSCKSTESRRSLSEGQAFGVFLLVFAKGKALPVRSRVVFPREGRTLVCQLSAHGLYNCALCDDEENDACSCPPLSHSQ